MSNDDEHMPSEERLRELFVGRKVERVEITGETGRLQLSDGTVLKVWGNDGGCGCNAGCYPLARLAEFDNVITNVEVEAHPVGDEYDGEGYYRIHVFAGQKKSVLASFEGTDGNGYYGTGWWLAVSSS